MSRKQGSQYEQQAARFLKRQGLKLLAENFHAHRGELDLVMLDDSTLVFVEVRYRQHQRFGTAADSITSRKQQHLLKAAQTYLQRHPGHAWRPCRFDVVTFQGNGTGHIKPPELNWIKNAFLIT